jgi:ArsR family transcriptional regulator
MASASAVEGDTMKLLRVLAEPLRWRIVNLLAVEELCVCHLVEELEIAQPLVSHHLRALRAAGLVETEKWRYWTYYRLRRDRLATIAGDLRALASEQAPAAGTSRRACC